MLQTSHLNLTCITGVTDAMTMSCSLPGFVHYRVSHRKSIRSMDQLEVTIFRFHATSVAWYTGMWLVGKNQRSIVMYEQLSPLMSH